MAGSGVVMECHWSGKDLGIIPYLPQTNSNTGIPAGPLSSASIPTFTAELRRCQVLEKQHIAMVACRGVEIPPGYMLFLALSQHLGNRPPRLRTPRDPKHPSNGKMRREAVEVTFRFVCFPAVCRGYVERRGSNSPHSR